MKMFEYKHIYTCPSCGHTIAPCDWTGCAAPAMVEGWYGSGLIRRMSVCDEHAKKLRGYDEFIGREENDDDESD